ncbi:glycosyltransferase family 2 protein [Chromobacterium violaceum]|uniref:glycosyltransferase family A protein n=1 Tax=Chromobacterium violaceum TaxID=536 RepID=UPI001BE7E6AF|nr:glycosyltransferase family A protein [Chromobacterium violaceum]MBT2869260.1 glycosyltransferase family 2 protein [Chromobacterium violaceum]
MQKMLSIVIPTKNRYNTLMPVLDVLCSNFSDADVEIIVEDNSDDNSLFIKYLSNINSNHILYHHNIKKVSIVENAESALKRASATYVLFIGDDDIVSPHIISFLRKLKEENSEIEAISYPAGYYWWDSVRFKKETPFYSACALWYPSETDLKIHMQNTLEELDFALYQGGTAIFNLPRLYHGIVKNSVLDMIRTRAGKLINGASPDMALSVALSLTITEHAYVNFPLTVYGASKNSGGGLTAENKHYGRIEDQKHLPKDSIENWSSNLPRIWSENIVYAQSIIEVLRAFNSTKKINFSAFYATLLVNEVHLYSETIPYALSFFKSNKSDVVNFIIFLFKKTCGRIKREFNKRYFGMPFKLYRCNSIFDCNNILKNQDIIP